MSATHWLSVEECRGDLTDLLPVRETSLSMEKLGELERVFGPQGEFTMERMPVREAL